ncbi:hypothetical protein AB0F91_35405 [Amycolatopsis sp. NPDC023774]|uniref:hypothetical protein n=1 Tax=Amycolatopsis sp. NPDC023774 TaxID=3155015 RepID=UPI00340187BC
MWSWPWSSRPSRTSPALTGYRPAELGSHLAYLATSLVLLPTATVWSAGEDGRWGAVVITVALLALAVVVVRAETTWRPA